MIEIAQAKEGIFKSEMFDVSKVLRDAVADALGADVHLPEPAQGIDDAKALEAIGVTVEVKGKYRDHPFCHDARKIGQILRNLIGNAIKFTEKGEVLVQVACEDAGTKLRFSVSDTGIGISREDQEKIFSRFFRVDKARSREQGGSGLGLSICKWIVEAHQGEIKVQSEFGKGSSFIVTLPLSSPRIMN